MSRTMSLLLLAGVSIGLWSAATACGSEAGVDEPLGADGSVDGSQGDGSGGGGGGDGDGGDAQDAGFDCGLTPELHPQKGLRCPNVTDAGTAATCASGSVCCQPPVDAGEEERSICGAACSTDGGPFNGVVWECQDQAHCAGSAAGPTCCGLGPISFDSTCGYLRARPFFGTSCRAQCAANEFIVCEEQSHCPGNTVCKPLKARGAQLGACLPP